MKFDINTVARIDFLDGSSICQRPTPLQPDGYNGNVWYINDTGTIEFFTSFEEAFEKLISFKPELRPPCFSVKS